MFHVSGTTFLPFKFWNEVQILDWEEFGLLPEHGYN